MSLGFNTSTRKEDVSLRLRAHLRGEKKETEKLMDDSGRMELRLRELKEAMTLEREMRETAGNAGGSRWKTGEKGSLGKEYTSRVLTKQKEQKPKRIRVLKDEPIAVPEKGTSALAKFAVREEARRRGGKEAKGIKCGQCELKQAAVTCVECGEDFCASCFASFHLKGALRKHRSVPVTAKSTPRVAMSPRPSSQRSSSSKTTPPQSTLARQRPPPQHTTDVVAHRNGTAADTDNNLLDGAYNEAGSAEEFQAALAAWRNGDLATSGEAKATSGVTPRVASRAQTPVYKMETATETTESKKEIKVEFQKPGLSYAERLLLKQHRRSDVMPVDAAATPRSAGGSDPMVEHRYSVAVAPGEVQEGERVQFGALYEAMTGEQALPPSRPVSSLSIIDLADERVAPKFPSSRAFESSSVYVVQEALEPDLLSVADRRIHDSVQSNRTAFLKTKTAFTTESNATSSKENQWPTDSKAPTSAKQSQKAEHLSTCKDDVETVEKPSASTKRTKESAPKQTSSSGGNKRPSSARPKSARPNSARPTSARPKSRGQGFRDPRPPSRAERAAAAKATYGFGGLTTGTSSALDELAAQASSLTPTCYEPVALTDFFTGGVKLDTQTEAAPPTSALRPKSARTKSAKAGAGITVSNRTYQLAPRSWRPTSALADTVDELQVRAHYKDFLPPAKAEDPVIFTETISFNLRQQKEGFFDEGAPKKGKGKKKEKDVFVDVTVDSALRSLQQSLDPDTTPRPDTAQSRDMTPRPDTARSRVEEALSRNVMASGYNSGVYDASSYKALSRPSSAASSRASASFSQDLAASLKGAVGGQGYTGAPGSSRPGSSLSRATPTPRIVNPHRRVPARDVAPSPPATPRASGHYSGRRSARMTPMSGRRTSSRLGREASQIVVDGDDLSRYDGQEARDQERQEARDEAEALNKLEWEMSSERGEEGRVSRLNELEDLYPRRAESDEEEEEGYVEQELGRLTGRLDTGVDITAQFNEDELDVDVGSGEEESDMRDVHLLQ